MQAEQAKTRGQLYREELAAGQDKAWPTHLSTQHSLTQNLAAPFLYGLKAIGEPFMAPARAARGIPGVDTALRGAGMLNKWLASKPRLIDPQGNIQVTHDGLGDYVVPEAPAVVDPNAGYYPADMAALAPGLKDRFAEGGSAVFGERARAKMEEVGAPRRQAQQDAEAALWADPRKSQTIVNQALSKLPLVGAAFDPQTQSVGEKLGEESGNPYMGMALDAVAGVSPLGLAKGVPALARSIAGRFSMPAGRAGAILGAEVNPVTRAAPFVSGLAERAATKLAEPGGMLDRWLATTSKAERGLDAQTQLPAIQEAAPMPGAAQAPPVTRLGREAGREAGRPAPDAPPVAARDGAPTPPPPARDILGEPLPPTPKPAVGPTLEEVKASLDAAKKEFNSLNSASIDGALSEADKARMIFLRTALPGLQKQLKQITKAAATEGVQYSGTLPGRAANVYRLLQEITPEQLVQFSTRADELAKSMGGRKARTAARRQVLEEMLAADPEGVQYAGQAPQFNQGPQPGPRVAPQPQPGPSSPPPATTTQAGARVAPGVDLSGNVKSEPLINRDIRDTIGMISRGETQEPGLVGKLRNALSSRNGPRLSYGEGGLPAGADGAHHGKRELIQIRRPVDGDTTYHELGHYIAKQGRIIDDAPAPAMGELAALGDPANPLVPKSKRGTKSSWAPGMSDDYKRGEGWAEYLRVWMSHPDEAERLAPEMTKHFEGWLDSQGAVGKRMRQHQADVQARAAADFARRMDAQVMMQKTRNQLEAQSSKDDLTTRFWDRFHPLRKMRDLAGDVDEIRPSEDFYRKATMLASTVKNETTREVDRLADIFREVREAPNPRQAEDELRRYLYARRAQELHDRGMRSGFDQSDIDQALRQYATPTNEKIANELYKFQDEQLEYLHEMGMLSDEALAKIRAENKAYIPMQRHFELGAGELSNQRAGIAGASLKASNPIKAIRGSEREILDPLVGVIANTFKVRMSAAKNEVLRDLLRLWDKHGAKVGHGIEEVHPPQTFTPAAVGELLKEPKLRAALEDLGVDVSQVTPVELETLIEMLPEGTIARPNQAMLDAQHVIPIRDGGKTRYLKLTPEMHRSLTGIGSEFTTDPMSWLNNHAGNVLRAGATSLNWKFAIRNAIRDSLVLPLISRVGGKTNLPFFPFADGLITNLRAAAGNPKAKEIVKRWRESGGRQDFGAQYADRTGAEAVLYDGVLPSRSAAPVRAAKTVGRAAKRVLGLVSEGSEDATRLGHYKAAEAYARRTHPHWTERDIHLFAAFEARDALDFSRRGSAPAVRWARANIPFLGAGTEGTRRQIEAAIENPARYFGMGVATASVPTVVNQTGIPGLVEGQWNNPDYWQLDQRKRDNDTILKNPLWDGVDSNQEFLKWPREKGPAGLFAQVPEWIATAARGDDASPSKRAKEMAGVVASDFLPAGVNPLEPKSLWNLLGEGSGLGAEMMANYDSFRDKPIVPEWMTRQHPDPSQQYDDRTSVLARFLGEKLGVSPMYIDHAIYGTTAGLGQTALNYVIDPALSAATQQTDKPIKEAPSRQVTSPSQALLDMSGLGVYPGQPASVKAFDAQLLERKKAKDRAVAHPRNKREAKQAARTLAPAERSKLKRMEILDRKINSLQRQLRQPEQTPEMKRALEMELREALKDYRPFKEVGP